MSLLRKWQPNQRRYLAYSGYRLQLIPIQCTLFTRLPTAEEYITLSSSTLLSDIVSVIGGKDVLDSVNGLWFALWQGCRSSAHLPHPKEKMKVKGRIWVSQGHLMSKKYNLL